MTSMTSQATEGACAFAGRNYLLLHSGSEEDNRRSTLRRYVTDLRDTGEYDFDLLQIAVNGMVRRTAWGSNSDLGRERDIARASRCRVGSWRAA
jgi:hypothetical protein